MADLKIIPLGGVGEIGKNCSVVEQGEDLIIIDCGLSFPNEEMMGVDIVIPDFTYLEQNKDRIRGLFITHAHEDHVGSITYLLDKVKVPIYATALAHALIENKLGERHNVKALDLRTFEPGDIIQAGSLKVETVRITHSIPDTCAMAIHTKYGVVLFTADFKFDFTPIDGKLTNFSRLGELGNEGVLCLLSDSTNVERPGWGPSERSVTKGLQAVMAGAKGRVLLTTFASNIHRMQQYMDVAAEFGRKVMVVGRRMEQNIDICSRMKLLKVPKNTLIRLDEAKMYQDDQIAVLTTGSQGEPMSALVQMSKGEYGRFQVKNGDTLIYSARPIPGNEAAIWRTVNRLFRLGCKVVYEAPTPIHVSGHAYQEELKMMINLTRPFYIAPVHGEPRHQDLYTKIAYTMGYPEHRVFTLEDGMELCFDETKAWLGDTVPHGRVLVDNAGNPGISDEVLRDRSNISRDGIVVVSLALDVEMGEFIGEPIIMAKGFNEPVGLLPQVNQILMDGLCQLTKNDLTDATRVKHEAQDIVRRAIQKKANLRPMVLTVVAEV